MNDLSNKVSFEQGFNGSFYSVLRWHQLDKLWQKLKHNAQQGWFLYTTSTLVPEKVATAEEMIAFIEQLDQQLRELHREDYCGLVYVDDLHNPSFIKIYNPANFRGSCSCSPAALPGWIISRQKPQDLQALESARVKLKKKRWWWPIGN